MTTYRIRRQGGTHPHPDGLRVQVGGGPCDDPVFQPGVELDFQVPVTNTFHLEATHTSRRLIEPTPKSLPRAWEGNRRPHALTMG